MENIMKIHVITKYLRLINLTKPIISTSAID